MGYRQAGRGPERGGCGRLVRVRRAFGGNSLCIKAKDVRVATIKPVMTPPSRVDPLSNRDVEPCLSIVMPVFNEAPTIAEALRRVRPDLRRREEDQLERWRVGVYLRSQVQPFLPNGP